MNTTVRNKLIEVARKKTIIHYQDLCNQSNLKLDMHYNPSDRTEIGRILGEISRHEYKNKRPLLSAVVLSKSMEEGDGFFKLCEDMGLIGDWRNAKNDVTFSNGHINACHDFWRNNDNYTKYK